MKKIIVVLILIFCGAKYSFAQEKSKAYATTFRHVVRAYATKEGVVSQLINYPKWRLDTSMRISASYTDSERWFTDAAFRAESAKYFMAFQGGSKCQLYVGNGKTLSGTYRVEAIVDAFANEQTPASTQEIERRKKEEMNKIVDKSVGHKAGSNDYFLYINVPGMPQEAKFEIQIMAGNKMLLYIDQSDQVNQWLGEEPKQSKIKSKK